MTQSMANPSGDALTVVCIFIIVAAFMRIRGLSIELRNSPLSQSWRILDLYVSFFIAGYIAYAFVYWNQFQQWSELVVPVILFFGAVFVFLVSLLAHQTVQDLQRVALLEHQSVTDPLTGLYNRRHLDQRISAEYASAHRYRHPLSVLMLDIDHFKQLNDTHGHQAGDLALQFVSGLVLDGIREPDIAARYGGEEFTIIAPNTRLHAASELAERIRKRIETHELKLARAGESRQTIRITVSIGVAELTPGIMSGKQLIQCADQALYRAKQSGRNRVSLYHPNQSDPFGSPTSAKSDA
jgi:diguanylate cyclase (GGDEF)-like protein